MRYRTRTGNDVYANDGQDRFLRLLYGTAPGRFAVKLLTKPAVSKLGGVILKSPLSRPFIGPFVRKNQIDLKLYEGVPYRSYNDFFIRRIKKENRPFDPESSHLVSPCDGKLTVLPISKEGQFCVKHTLYTAESLLKNKGLAKRYEGGLALLFRLTVDDYHHYFYVDSGRKSRNVTIPGLFHTVNPTANDVYPIYKENTRQYSLLKSDHFGTLLMMEVGALMVGRIVNLHEAAQVSLGEEKGFFEFGGSTVILLFQADRIQVDEDILNNSREGIETIVKAGERIGKAIR